MMDSEAWRRECEARAWIQRTGGNPAKVEALLKRIAEKRGKEAAETLREDMREQWRVRAFRGADTTTVTGK